MWRPFEAEILVTRPTEIEYRDGMFHVTDYFSENCVIRRAYCPSIYLASLQGANAALAKWQQEQVNGVAEFHRAFEVKAVG